MLWLKLAWRNTWRHPRRSGLTVAVIAFGVTALVLAWSLFDGSNNQSISTMTGTFTGHVQIHRAGYTDDPSLDLSFAAAEVDSVALSRVPGVLAAAPRLQAPVMVSTEALSRGVLLVGVDPAQERRVTSLHEKVSTGRWLDDKGGGIVVGSSLAKALNVSVGSEIAVLTQGLQGSIGANRFTVAGVYDTGNEMIDGLQAFISLGDARALLSAGDELSTMVVKLDHYDRSDPAVRELARWLGPKLEVKGWRDLLPDVAQKVAFHEWVATIVMFVLFGIVMVGVTNSVLMAALERMREFGTAMALGTRPAYLFLLIVLEAALLGVLGFVIGIAIGGGLVAHLSSQGIDLASHSNALQQMPGLSTTLHPHLSAYRALMIGAGVALVTVGAAVYPAWKIARLSPLAAMRGLAGASGRSRAGRERAAGALLPMLALRNIGRHPVRSALTGFGIAFALAAFVFLGGFVTGYYRQIVENSTGFITGDGQVQHRDYKARLDASLSLDDGPALLARIRDLASVRAASPRVQSPGLVASPKGSEPVQLIGVAPDTERDVTFLYKSIHAGRYLDSARDGEVVLGRKLADRLRVAVGDKVVVMAQDVKGELSSEAFVVVGLFDTGSHSFDETMAQVSLPALQRVLGLADRYSSITFRARDTDEPEAALQAVRALVEQPNATVYSWRDLLPEVVQMNGMFKGSLLLVMLIVFSTISIVIANTVLMSVLERTREFGTLLALGTPGPFIVRLVLLEALMLGGIGALIGTGFGSLMVWVHSITGMSMKAHSMTAIPGTTDVVYPQLSFAVTVPPGVLIPVLMLLVAAYPAWRASRLEPVQAMRAV
ncbi:MAG TPA: ABC transporter permease [Ideonella sp.]|uniref:ABC transporter permease n=1 Tax=Ideonella sp. TaxID=1929293 RepID=UPI002E36A13D|nr:ABC transporter permease [Ideonella sp.]HEX5686533.1 ABC transporter permease [Ideonella sp.]